MTALLEQAIAKARQLPDDVQHKVAVLWLRILDNLDSKNTETPKPGRKAGSAKGMIWMAPDFDAPLEDFKDYM